MKAAWLDNRIQKLRSLIMIAFHVVNIDFFACSSTSIAMERQRRWEIWKS